MIPAPLSEAELLGMMDGDIAIMVLVQGMLTDNTPHYAYASIPPSRYQAFKEAEAKGYYNLADYGKILAHGAGETPPAQVQKQMEDEYGANHYFEEQMDEWMQSMQQLLIKNPK